MTKPLDDLLHKIQSLIAKADSVENEYPEEAKTYRDKAEALMLKYRIDEMQLPTSDERAGITPIWRTIRICVADSEFMGAYRYIGGRCLQHVDARTSYSQLIHEDGIYYHTWEACGYDSDLRYAELLHTSFSLAFAAKMEPRVNPHLSEAENCYNLRNAGKDGGQVSILMWGENNKTNRNRARKLFAQHATSLGEDPQQLLGLSNPMKAYRESYVDGFELEVSLRLRRMRQSHGSGELVLNSRKENVTTMFYTKYPDLDPSKVSNATAIGGRDSCAKCKKAEKGYCRDHMYLKPSTARYRERRTSAVGHERGRIAAQSVDLSSSGYEIR